MTVRTTERRRSVRMAASFPATIRNFRNRIVARGRTTDISEGGVFVVVHRNRYIPESGGEAFVDLIIPADPLAGTKREVTYRCKITRRQDLANMLGLGLQFIEKIA